MFIFFVILRLTWLHSFVNLYVYVCAFVLFVYAFDIFNKDYLLTYLRRQVIDRDQFHLRRSSGNRACL